MPRLSVLIDDLADRFSFEKTKLNSLARVMREAGLLTSGARGVNAPDATSLDAARLLIAMMLDSKIASVNEDVSLVGKFTVLRNSNPDANFSPTNFEDGFSQVLDMFGTAPDWYVHDLTGYVELTPYAALALIHLARIPEDEDQNIKEVEISFTHPDVKSNDTLTLPQSYHEAARRFPTGFKQKPIIDRHDLAEIGELIASSSK